MKDEQKQKFFDSTIKLFEDYRSKMIKKGHKGYNSNLSNEVHLRLRQLSFICEKLLHYEQIVLRPESSKKERCKQTRLFDEGIVFAEAFYFIAWRIITTTNHYTNPLPSRVGCATCLHTRNHSINPNPQFLSTLSFIYL